MAKRKLPEILRVWNECRREEGVKPFKPETQDQKRKIKECVIRKMGEKKK